MKINKILLVHSSFREGFHLNAIAVPLGLSYIAAVLEEDGFEVKEINLEVDDLKKEFKNMNCRACPEGSGYYHPHFFRKVLGMGLKKLFSRGVEIEDIRRLYNMVVKKT